MTGRSADRPLAVIAVGGNSLIRDKEHIAIPFQAETAAVTAGYIVQLVAQGWRVVVTHGNGPQVGYILQRSEMLIDVMPPVPMNYATSNTQGSLGYMFQRSLHNELHRTDLENGTVTLITQTLVSAEDPAFESPSKPIGPHMDESTARRRASELGWAIMEDAGRGWRRAVASPRPIAIVELDVIADLVSSGVIVIACGGGGLPVYRDEHGNLVGLEAVIDKDHASGLLATGLGADLLVISTGVERVAIHFNTPRQKWLEQMTVSEARRYQANGHFAAGSMGPKVEAMIEYVEAGGKRGVITDPSNLLAAVSGEAGTQIMPD